MKSNTSSIEEVRNLLFTFSEGYVRRDLSSLDTFMNLFVQDEDLEFIGVGGGSPRRGTWRIGREPVRDLIRADWEYWGSIKIDTNNARIDVLNNVAWLSTSGTVTTDDETEEFLGDKESMIGKVHSDASAGSRIKPLRMTAVVTKRESRWQFLQIHFSFSIRSLPK